MSGWQNAVTALCVVSVIGAIVRLLLPDNSLGASMKTVINLVVAAVVINSVLTLLGTLPDTPEYTYRSDNQQTEAYLTDRVVKSLTEETEKIVLDTLQQFGIKHGQISIDFNKGSYGNVTIKHILVYIPKEHAEDKQKLKNILLERFDVFCDVAVLEETDETVE